MTLTQSKINQLEDSVLDILTSKTKKTFLEHITLEKHYYELCKLYQQDELERHL